MTATSNVFGVQLAGAPAWFAAATAGQWTAVPLSNTMAQVGSAAQGQGYANAGEGFAWSGGSTSHVRRSILLGDIGGHTDGSSSEVLEIKLGDESPLFTQLKYGSTAVQDDPGGSYSYANGQPRAVHGWVGSMNIDEHYVHPILDGSYDKGTSYSVCYSLDLAACDLDTDALWTFRGDATAELGMSHNNNYSLACYDSVNRRIFVFRQAPSSQSNDLFTIDVPAIFANSWTYTLYATLAGGGPYTGGGYGTWAQSIYDQGYCLIGGGGESGGFGGEAPNPKLWAVDFDNITAGFVDLTTSGMIPQMNGDGAYGVYVPAENALFTWKSSASSSGGSGTGIYRCSLPSDGNFAAHTFTWTTVAGSGANPSTGHNWGNPRGGSMPHSRFNYVEDMGAGKGCLTLVSPDGSAAWVWKFA